MGGSLDIEGVQFGVKCHYYISLSPTFILGLGVFLQQSKIKDFDDPRRAFGFDFAALFVLPNKPELSPYIRLTHSLFDKIDNLSGSGFGIGAGVKYDFNPQVRVFAELMYDSASYKRIGIEEVTETYTWGGMFIVKRTDILLNQNLILPGYQLMLEQHIY